MKNIKPPIQFAAVNEVRRRIIEHIMAGHYSSHKTLPTTRELAHSLDVSTATINRAMYYLQREGWVERHPGKGTVLGQRALHTDTDNTQPTLGSSIRRGMRIAVTLLPLDLSTSHWQAQGLLEGIDDAANKNDVTVEFLGACGGDNNRFAKRLEQSAPDFLIFLKPHIQNALLIREAERLNIPFVATGTRLRGMGIPAVEEDGEGGCFLATQRLIELGHKRIGLILPDSPEPFWHDRRHGYEKAMIEKFGKLDRNLIFWSGEESDSSVQRLANEYLEDQKPTALILLGSGKLDLLTPHIQSGKIRVPDNLSVIIFDQLYDYHKARLNQLTSTVIWLPMHEMASKAVEIACDYKKGIPIPQRTIIPCRLVEGQTTQPPLKDF